MPDIGEISVLVSVTVMLVQIDQYQYQMAEYIGIGIGWNHMGPSNPTYIVIELLIIIIMRCPK